MVEVERVSREADPFNPTGIQALTILDSLTFCQQVPGACRRDLRPARCCVSCCPSAAAAAVCSLDARLCRRIKC